MSVYELLHTQAEAAGKKAHESVYERALDEARLAKDAAYTERDSLGRDLVKTQTELSESRAQNGTLTDQRDASFRVRDAALTERDLARQGVAERDALVVQLRARIAELEPVVPPTRKPGANIRAYATVEEARTALGIPVARAMVALTPGETLTALSRKQPAALVVVPADANPAAVVLDSSKGFRASDTVAMEYISDEDYLTKGLVPKDKPGNAPKPYSDKYVTGMTPVEPTPGYWFSLLRTAGIIGLGRVPVTVSDSGYRGQRQPKSSMGVHDRRDTQDPKRLFLHIGSQQKLIETVDPSPVFANVRIEGRDLGTIAYSALAAGKSGGGAMIRDVEVGPLASSGFAGIPNGESGGLALGGRIDVDGLTIEASDRLSSPIMFNRTEGGVAKHVEIGKHRIGMVTFWRSGGKNVFEDFVTNAGTVGINLEEELEGFELEWRGGAIRTDAAGHTKHVNLINSADHSGSIKVRFIDVEVTTNSGYAPGKLVVHRSGRSGVQKRSDITWNRGEVACVGSGWID